MSGSIYLSVLLSPTSAPDIYIIHISIDYTGEEIVKVEAAADILCIGEYIGDWLFSGRLIKKVAA